MSIEKRKTRAFQGRKHATVQLRKLNYLFRPKSIAIIGASTTQTKIGNVVMRNLIDGKYGGTIYPVNPRHNEVLGLRCYPSVLKIKERVDCAVIATPAPTVPGIVRECGKKKIPAVIVLSSGFGEVGNVELEKQLREVAQKYGIALVGVNCLGVFDPYSRVDSIFLPLHKLERPRPGNISFITQSGAVGSCIVDLAAHYKIGVAKFISYGNGTVLDETAFLEYLKHDNQTDVIVLYMEGAKDGRALLNKLDDVNKKKPIIVLKGGKFGKATEAAFSHTGNLAGSYLAYKSAFRQAKVTEAGSIDELFDFVRIFNQPLPHGNAVAVITNGGGIGVLAVDAIESEGLALSKIGEESKKILRKILPPHVNIRNPLDLAADAGVEHYEKAINQLMDDENNDALLVVVLTQTPPIDERIIGVLSRASDDRRKPIAVVTIGGDYTEKYRCILESKGVPTYGSPSTAVKAIKRLVDYAEHRKSNEKEGVHPLTSSNK